MSNQQHDDVYKLGDDDVAPDNDESTKVIIEHKATPIENWQRPPVMTGKGATHVKTFVAKLRQDSIEHLDQQINAWLDEHPDYEVKFVSQSVGELKGKISEPALIVCVWV